eukprot:jgi/Mesvir1/3060/Mv16466-RA.1
MEPSGSPEVATIVAPSASSPVDGESLGSKRERKEAELEILKLEVEREELEAKRRRLMMDSRLYELEFKVKAMDRLSNLMKALSNNNRLLGIGGIDYHEIEVLHERERDAIMGKRDDGPAPRGMINVEMVAREMGYDLHPDDVASIDKVMEDKWRERFPEGTITRHGSAVIHELANDSVRE